MAFTQGFQVAPVQSAPLARALPPVLTGQIDSGAFKVDLVTPMVQGIAAGQSLVKPLAEAAMEFSPEKVAERAFKKMELENNSFKMETERKMRPSDEQIARMAETAGAELSLRQRQISAQTKAYDRDDAGQKSALELSRLKTEQEAAELALKEAQQRATVNTLTPEDITRKQELERKVEELKASQLKLQSEAAAAGPLSSTIPSPKIFDVISGGYITNPAYEVWKKGAEEQAKEDVNLRGKAAEKGMANHRTASMEDVSKYLGNPSAKGPSSYDVSQKKNTLDAVRNLKNRVGQNTVGVGGKALRWAPLNTEAKDFKNDIQKLKASIAFGALAEMKASSASGGALGAVSEKEMQLLESVIAGLDLDQSPESMSKNLQIIEDSVTRWYNEVAKTQAPGEMKTQSSAQGGINAQQAEQLRTMLNDPALQDDERVAEAVEKLKAYDALKKK